MSEKTLTSANAVVMIRCKGVYDNWIRLQGFQADNAFAFGEANIAETVIGVDGHQAAGYTAHEMSWTLYLLASSASIQVMENIRKDANKNMEVRKIEFRIEIQATKELYTPTGYLTKTSGGATAKKILEGRQYDFNVINHGAEELN